MTFFKNREEGKTGPSGSWHQWEGGGYKEGVQECDYGGKIMYSCMKMEKQDLLKVFQEWRKGG
jgi:hypothetical protein